MDGSKLALGSVVVLAVAAAAARRGSRSGDPKQVTLERLWKRIGVLDFRAWIDEEFGDDDSWDVYEQMAADHDLELELLEQYLEEKGSIEVRDDGLIEFWQLSSPALEIDVYQVIGDLPVALHHHTATGALPAIRREGLRSDVQRADQLSSGAGVYLTTEVSGPAVRGYGYKAARLHGGNPVCLTVRRTLDEIWPDPDDEDLSSGSVQWITGHVPPQDIVEWE